MSSEERKKILQMVQDGRISAEQAGSLMRALEEDEPVPQVEILETGTASGGAESESAEFEAVKQRARRFVMIPLWIGVFLTVLSAWGLYAVQRDAGVNFWFLCLLVPLLLGILLIALGTRSQNSKWLYVNVDRQNTREWPRNITLAFPLPLGLAAWLLRNFGRYIHGMNHVPVDDILEILDATEKTGEPIIVNANDGEAGEYVQVYIG